MKFLIKSVNENVKKMYESHSTYHEGDSGLDLFIIKDQIIPAGETKLIDLGISCQLKDTKTDHYFSYNMYSRSSIYKTPLRLANGVGLLDGGFQGMVKCPLHNTGTTDYTIKKGERYVQLARPDLGEISFELVEGFDRTTTRR